MISTTRQLDPSFESSACALVLCDPDGTIREANPLLSLWTGKNREDLSGIPFARLLTPASALLFELQLRPRLALGQRIDGALVTVVATSPPAVSAVLSAVQRDDGGFDLALQSVREREAFEASLRRAHAETEAARAALADTARALRESEALVRAQFTATPLPTLVWRRDAHDQFLLDSHNAVAAHLFDTPPAIGSLDASLVFGASAVPLQAMQDAITRGTVVEVELDDAPRTLGAARSLVLTVGPLPPDRVVMHVRDVTRERAIEAQQRHGFKMQALGQLVAGIAHEFNNVLSVISGNLELMRGELETLVPAGHQVREDADTIQDATRRAVGLVAQLLAFGGRQPVACGRLDLHELLRASERLLRPVLGRTIAWELQLDVAPAWVRADRDQLLQVITNLVINARDAVLERAAGGTITIHTGWVHVPDPQLVLSEALAPGRYLRVAVQDTGIGMSDEVRSRAFEPFFTTKPVGHGTGLGLSTIYGIVRELGGVVEIDSTPGSGTTVWMLLPDASDAADT